jgi:hypothetical protein
MALQDISDPDAVLQALAEYDKLGQEAFLSKYGFGPALKYRIRHDGRLYDIKAVLAAAHGFEFPEKGPLVADKNFTSGLDTTVPKARELGFEVDDYDPEPAATGNAWIFQSNPAFYDIHGAVQALKAMNWSINQGKNLIAVGDRVYIWESGRDGGVIAEGRILSRPEMLADQEGAEFIRDPDRFAGESLRVRLSIERTLPEPLLRSELIDHPVLRDLGVIKFASATNYKLTPGQDTALQALIAARSKPPTLEQRVEQWLFETGYPDERERDYENRTRRQQLAEALSPANLDEVVADPAVFEKLAFGQLAHRVYGNAGNQSAVNSFLKNGGLEERGRLARTLRHLLYGDGDVVSRLDDVLENPEWKVPGFSEVLATKALSVVYPDEWIPMFRVEGEMGKLRIAESPELELSVLGEPESRSLAELSKWTNDVLRARVDPHIPNDPWGQMVFLYWLREQPQPADQPRVWWVNQGTHYREERDGGYVWAPLADRNGRPMRHWESLREASPGELVLSYANGRLRGVGTIESDAVEAPRPAELGDDWEEEGLMVKVRYSELPESISLDDIPVAWRLEQGAPFDKRGVVQQKGYFFALGPAFVGRLAARFPQLGLGQGDEPTTAEDDYEEPDLPAIAKAIRDEGMSITDRVLGRYHVSLKTRGFVILSGVSGTGKTWLARLYAEAVGATALVVPVAPNWTANEDLLGFQSPMSKEFQATEFTRFLRRSAAEWQAAQTEKRRPRPFHLILDEMNLAHVEYYFAKFLSAMEIRATHGEAEIELAPGSQVMLPPNLVFVGTVNVDETTRGFADKVYDRAQLLELEISRDALAAHVGDAVYADDLLATWDAVHDIAPFAFRVADEIGAYIHEAGRLGVPWEAAFDEQLLQKVMPKIKGADLRIGGSLKALLDLSDSRFPLTHAKTRKMRDGFAEHGFASYF